MRRFVDGKEVVLEPGHARVRRHSDRFLVHTENGTWSAVTVRSGDSVHISYKGRTYRVERAAARGRTVRGGETGEIYSPMPGMIADVLVGLGDSVGDGDKLLVLEAMKTQQPFFAPYPGIVRALHVSAGDQVREGQLLIFIEPEPRN